MSRVPAAMARRLDRLARGAHGFHRFAHHPLCAPYRGELLRVGRRAVVCRGCALALLGAAAGALAASVAPIPPAAFLLAAVAALLPVALTAVRAPPPGGQRSKLLTRAVPTALLVATATLGLRAGRPAGVAVTLGALAVGAVARRAYRRRQPDRAPCAACPEFAGTRVCSGFRAIARREAAFARVAGRLLRGVPARPQPG